MRMLDRYGNLRPKIRVNLTPLALVPRGEGLGVRGTINQRLGVLCFLEFGSF
ncbi:MAG: hypothetical protein JWN70_395 [Planctomycetaceae bacterium]|nr:hypothetical protein [Planctomycetaceae bacterium]